MKKFGEHCSFDSNSMKKNESDWNIISNFKRCLNMRDDRQVDFHLEFLMTF